MRHCGASPVVPCSRSFCGCRSSAEISLTFRVTPPHTRQIVVSWWNSQLPLMGAPSRRTVVVRSPHMTLGLLECIGGQRLFLYDNSGLPFPFLVSYFLLRVIEYFILALEGDSPYCGDDTCKRLSFGVKSKDFGLLPIIHYNSINI